MADHKHEFDHFHYCVHCRMTREQVFRPERIPSPALVRRREQQLAEVERNAQRIGRVRA